MKKLFSVFTMLFSLSFLAQSCQKTVENDNNNKETTTPTIKKNQSFQYEFGLIGLEDRLSISEQAKHFEISSLKRDNKGKMIYNYTPNLNYVGTDDVEITLSISDGASMVNTIRTKIKLTITD